MIPIWKNCHPKRSLSQSQRERPGRRTCGYPTTAIHFHLRTTMKLAPLLLLATLATSTLNAQPANKPIRVAIVGLVHGHVKGFLAALPKNPNAQLVAIVEPNITLAQQSEEHTSELQSRQY